jgi:hypothetical protein
VLAPGALTDEEAHDIRPGVYHLLGGSYEAHAEKMRERIADIGKGATHETC